MPHCSKHDIPCKDQSTKTVSFVFLSKGDVIDIFKTHLYAATGALPHEGAAKHISRMVAWVRVFFLEVSGYGILILRPCNPESL